MNVTTLPRKEKALALRIAALVGTRDPNTSLIALSMVVASIASQHGREKELFVTVFSEMIRTVMDAQTAKRK